MQMQQNRGSNLCNLTKPTLVPIFFKEDSEPVLTQIAFLPSLKKIDTNRESIFSNSK
jgi:hypothetical protein